MYSKHALSLFVAITLSLLPNTLEAQPTEIIIQAGENLTDSNNLLDNASLLGIRINHYIENDNAVMLGYDHIFRAKFRHNTHSDPKNIPEGYILNPAYKVPTKSDVDRFYLNGLHDFHLEQNNVKLFTFAGIGYERAYEDYEGLKSKGFFNLGGGLKSEISQNILFIGEINALQKFDWKRYDFSLALGLGYVFDNHPNLVDPIVELTAFDKIKTEPKKVTIQKSPDYLQLSQSIKTKVTTTHLKPIHPPVGGMQNKKFYVQLAAASYVNQTYIKKLQKMGESYSLKHTGNVTLLLAGPYKTYRLAKIKTAMLKSIDAGAFVKRMH